jgi:hypothetical protein
MASVEGFKDEVGCWKASDDLIVTVQDMLQDEGLEGQII